MRALRHAITPKTYVSEEYPEVENAWLAFGIKVTLVCDNGLEFHAHQLRRMCAELNIELIFCPKKQPHYKGAIERFLGTFNRQLSHKIEGTTFSNIEQRGDYDAENLANLTLAEFKKLLHVWLIDVYIQAPHKSLGITPALAWKDGLKIIEPVLPESKEKLDLILAIQKTRKLNHEGVQFIGLMYNSAELAVLRKRGIASVTIRINPEDLGEIWVFDEHQGDYLKVPCTYLEYASKLTLAQHLLIRKKPTKPMQNASIWIYICGERKSCACLLLRSATARNSASEKRPLATTPKSFNNRPIRRMCYRQKSVSSLIKIIGLMTYRTLMLIVRRLNMLDQSKLNQTWASMSKLIIKYPAFNDAYQLLKDAYLFNLQTGLTKNYLLVGNGYR